MRVDAASEARGSIRLARVSKSFGAEPILDGIDLAVAPGEVVSLIGPSGCGKSTVLRLLAGLDRPSAGELRVDGQPVDGPSRATGMVFQEPRLLPWLDVERNIAFGLAGTARELRQRTVARLLGQVHLEHAGGLYPRQLSGGMQQRTAIARALATEPDILLLDEPFSALDAFTRIHLQDLVLELWERTRLTTVLVTHDIDEALYLSDRIVVLSTRPARVLEEIEVLVPRPRNRGDYELVRLRSRLLEQLRLAGRWNRPHPDYEI